MPEVASAVAHRDALALSRARRVLDASSLLPHEQHQLFERVYLRGQPKDVVCRELVIAPEQYEERHAAVIAFFKTPGAYQLGV
jgi:hypothetical protein